MAKGHVALIRLHGRNRNMWERKGVTATEREWVPRIRELTAKTRQLHVLFNNCYADKAVTNARQVKLMLD